MVTKNQIKLITSLVQKKYRKQHHLFFAEGIKVINELIDSKFELDHVYCTSDLFSDLTPSKKQLYLNRI